MTNLIANHHTAAPAAPADPARPAGPARPADPVGAARTGGTPVIRGRGIGGHHEHPGHSGHPVDQPGPPESLLGSMVDSMETVSEVVSDAVEVIRPKLRGWLHAALTPLILVAGIVLVATAPPGPARAAAVVFVSSSVLLFGVSALYNTRSARFSERVELFWKRFDHANIFVLIAGSYTPFVVLLLEGTTRGVMLTSVWAGAAAGVVFRVGWPNAPRWLYTPCYIALGWVAILVVDDFAAASSAAVVALLAAGGVLYTVGGVIYALRRPNPFPAWFGFHEVFHACTVLAFLSHYVAVALVTHAS